MTTIFNIPIEKLHPLDMFKQLYKYCPNCGAKMDLPFVPLERCPGDVCCGVDRSVEAGKVGV